MYCNNNKCYQPNPPREWSRVQSSCTYDYEPCYDGKQLIYIPILNKSVPASEASYWYALINKGNILQYKNNSSNLTKKQIYSKIAKGNWINRNTTWATQNTRGYTNPNNTMLKRNGNVFNLAINSQTGTIIGPTLAPPTCYNMLPNIINSMIPPAGNGDSYDEPTLLPPQISPDPAAQGDNFPLVEPPQPPEPIVIQDQGNLICNEMFNICTGESSKQPSFTAYNLTTDSDVPGPIDILYWNNGAATWYPRQRYVMTNSGNKWPYTTNTVAITSAIRPESPKVTLIPIDFTTVKLTWTYSNECLEIESFDIFVNNGLVANVKVPTTTYTITDLLEDEIYDFSVIAVSRIG